MEEGERVGGQTEDEKEGAGGEEAEGAISGFATCLAASLLKETMKEKEGEAAVWAIPCSSDCHNHGARPPEEGGGGGVKKLNIGTVNLHNWDSLSVNLLSIDRVNSSQRVKLVPHLVQLEVKAQIVQR